MILSYYLSLVKIRPEKMVLVMNAKPVYPVMVRFILRSIDHKTPVSKFPQNTPQNVVNALSNLQPLWASENLSKGNRLAA